MDLEVGDGIRVTDVRRSDQAALIEYLNDREVFERTLRIPFPYTADDAEWYFNHVAQVTERFGFSLNWAIRNVDDRLIGGISLYADRPPISHREEIGYWLAKPFWGRGIMPNVVRGVCAYAFTEFSLAKVTAHVFVTNTASARVLEKCGFEFEGLIRRHYFKDGRFIDGKAYGLPAPDA